LWIEFRFWQMSIHLRYLIGQEILRQNNIQKLRATISKVADKRTEYQHRHSINLQGYIVWFERVVVAAKDLGFNEKIFREMNRDTTWIYYFLRGYSPKDAVAKELAMS
jgi:hypothetical protein